MAMKRCRNKSKVEKLQKLNAGLANDISYGWELTLNVCMLEPKANKFHIVLLSRGRKSDKKGKRVASQYYDSELTAENNIFSFRKSYKLQAAKRRLDVWEVMIESEVENDVMK